MLVRGDGPGPDHTPRLVLLLFSLALAVAVPLMEIIKVFLYLIKIVTTSPAVIIPPANEDMMAVLALK